MVVKSKEQLDGLILAGSAVANVLKKMTAYTEVGMSTKELDEYGGKLLKEYGCNSAPMKDYNFPGYACISVNNEVCHGIPSKNTILKEGDLINIDVSGELGGYYGDNGNSFIIGEDIQGLQPLVDASREILNKAIGIIKHRVRVADIGGLIHTEARKKGYTVIKNLCGHGIGHKLHDGNIELANYRDRLNRTRLNLNTVIALETFISTKGNYVNQQDDGWTMKTRDLSFVTQHEHTIVITDGFPILTTIENGVSDGYYDNVQILK